MQVTELPVRRWTQDYKEFLEGLIKPDTSEVLPAWMKHLHTMSRAKSVGPCCPAPNAGRP